MTEISEKQRALRKKHKNKDEIKVIFRATATQKAQLDELCEYHNITMTDFCHRSIAVAYKSMVERHRQDEKARQKTEEKKRQIDWIDRHKK